MTITTEDLRKLLDGVRAPETSLSVSFQIAACRNKLEGASESLATELIAARAKIEAAEKLAEAMAALDKAASEVARLGAVTGPQWTRLTVASLKARSALAAWESLK